MDKAKPLPPLDPIPPTDDFDWDIDMDDDYFTNNEEED